MRILVTGATGFLGGRLTERLAEQGHEVVAAARTASKKSFPAGVTARDLDITRPETLAGACDDVDAVVHAAALVGDWGEREAFFRFDEGGTRHVLEEARRAGTGRVVHVSSISVYGQRCAGDVTEDTPRSPEGAHYADAKCAAEVVVEALREAGLPVTVVRPGNIYGPNSVHWTDRPASLIQKGLMSIPKGYGLANTVYVDNVCALIERCLEHDAAPGETFHVVDEPHVDWLAFFSGYAEVFGKKVPVRPVSVLNALGFVLENAARLTRSRPLATREAVEFILFKGRFVMDKAERVLGWTTPVSPDEGMARTQAYLRDG